VGGQCHALAALYLWERAGTDCIGGWVGPRPDLDWYGNIATVSLYVIYTLHVSTFAVIIREFYICAFPS